MASGFVGTLRLCMCFLLIGSLIPWYLGVLIAAAFLYVDSKDLDVRRHASSAMNWAEARTPMPVAVLLGVLRRMTGGKAANAAADQAELTEAGASASPSTTPLTGDAKDFDDLFGGPAYKP